MHLEHPVFLDRVEEWYLSFFFSEIASVFDVTVVKRIQSTGNWPFTTKNVNEPIRTLAKLPNPVPLSVGKGGTQCQAREEV